MKRLTLFLLVTALVLSCTKNTPPVIESLLAEPDSVYPGDTVTITFRVADIDGDGIAHMFHKPAGTWIIKIGTGDPAQWIAPKEPGDYYLTLTISDLTDKVADSVRIHVLDTAGVFIDSRDDHQYKWVKIGKQIWMAENLAYLPALSPGSIWSITIPYYYVYGNECSNIISTMGTANFKNYGVLYNWSAALTACPSGWHLPTDADWMILEKNKGMSADVVETIGYRYSGNVGNLLKESGTAHWKSPNESANNSTGFTAIPGGGYWDNGGYLGLGGSANFWSSSQDYSVTAWYRGLGDFHDGVHRDYQDRAFGFSVRCVKDELYFLNF